MYFLFLLSACVKQETKERKKNWNEILSTQFQCDFIFKNRVTFHGFMFDSLTKYVQHFRWISICFMIAKNVCSRYICIFPFACCFFIYFSFSARLISFFTSKNLYFSALIRHYNMRCLNSKSSIFINILIRLRRHKSRWFQIQIHVCSGENFFFGRSEKLSRVRVIVHFMSWLSLCFINAGNEIKKFLFKISVKWSKLKESVFISRVLLAVIDARINKGK